MRKDYEVYLKDILQAMRDIESFVAGITYQQFVDDDKTSSAVIRKFEIIGEAAKRVPDDIRRANVEVPWKEMAGMRDRLIHFYGGVDYVLLWKTIHERIPAVKPLLERMLGEER